MSRRFYARVERVIIGIMLIGIIGMFQPLALELYRYGFLLLLLSTILFIVISHISPKPDNPDATGTVSIERAAEQLQGHERHG
jgi:hypothetical protein